MDTETGNCSIEWGHPGDIKSRSYAPADANDTEPLTNRLQMGDEHNVPNDAAAAITYIHEPMRYPKDCPIITEGIMQLPEPVDPTIWLPHGRGAFIAGLMERTIPRNCCTKPFSSYHLGLNYSSEASLALNLPKEMVLIDRGTGAVRRIKDNWLNQPPPRTQHSHLYDINSDNELECRDGRRYHDESGYTSMPQGHYLIQTPSAAKAFLAAANRERPPAPAGPAKAQCDAGTMSTVSFKDIDPGQNEPSTPIVKNCHR